VHERTTLDLSSMSNPADHTNLTKKKKGHVTSRKSSVNIVSLQNGRTRTKKYLIGKGPATSSNAVDPIADPIAYDEDFTVHDVAMIEEVAGVDSNIVIVSANQQRKTKVRTSPSFLTVIDCRYSPRMTCSTTGWQKRTRTWTHSSISKTSAKRTCVATVTKPCIPYSIVKHV
jgi:hypothetical protein